mmetsp:Transcript_18478/g.23797  ORF Transcript_18478/g.23797 Transcript_18478/m.23797 type:complete len:449 (+) Transcript_18478:213-1559(+)|eukprot:CAMPEP_0198150456 /NCGR_PEP_ID=MMETSP1443-20131203/51002_1 /TAXON_ID=186043 /ORGANISM="Entomoneis sp., Strain CCMP2396" /LENGTH=448 /DNA_ID=CAMNT_0043815761 /DNA_START=115 /DNA_END=1461 /DNA_ORIENTATION=+
MNDYALDQYEEYDHAVGDDDGDLYLLSQTTGSPEDSSMGGANPNNIDFDVPEIASLPRILLMGPRRGGKTSIQRVVFQKMSPHETLFRLEPTHSLERSLVDHTKICRFTVQDFPGDYYGEDVAGDEVETSAMFAGQTSLIFVVDAQDEPYDHVLQSFTTVVTRALRVNPHITVEVFINKVDGELFLSDESKYDCRRDIMTQVTDELNDAGIPDGSLAIRYHLTSIYDHSIYEALSRVVQRLIPQLPTLENLLNVLTATCSMEKAYLFDVVSKLYISTDSGPVDMQSVELCSDMIDVVLDVSGIYGLPGESAIAAAEANAEKRTSLISQNGAAADDFGELMASNGDDDEMDLDNPTAYDKDSASVIRLSNGMILYLKEVDTMLALVCITRAENFKRRSLINYNILCLKQALRAIVAKPAATGENNNGKNTNATASSNPTTSAPLVAVAE